MPLAVGVGVSPIFGGKTAGAVFNPASLFTTEQGFVYDFTNLATMLQERTGASATTPSGADGPIGTLKDLSPNNNYCVPPSNAARPLSRQGVGSPNVYGEFDGVDDYLEATFAITQPFVRIASFRIISFTGDQIFGGVTSNAGVLYNSAVDTYSLFDGSTGPSVSIAIAEDIAVTERHSNTTSRIAKNNAAYSSGTTGTTLPGGVRLATQIAVSSFCNLRFYRAIAIARDLTDPEIAQCRTWCGAAAGLVL